MYRSSKTTVGRNMAGARALWRATGMQAADFGKPIIAIANSFSQFVPGHVHLKDIGKLVVQEIAKAGGVAKEFNTIAIDDGIAMGHDGMLYSLPSRDLIADSVEYMVNAHCADALVCISNCDKITPGMLMASMRLNVPTIFVSGGPMEAGKSQMLDFGIDLVDAMVLAANNGVDDQQLAEVERSACPTCGSCSGMFTANSMNCLTEALGIAFPCNGTLLATHTYRRILFEQAGHFIVAFANRYYEHDDARVLPREIVCKAAFDNAMTIDIAMGGSTNTILHLLAAANEAKVSFTMADVDRLSRSVPQLCKLAPNNRQYHIEDCHRAGGIMALIGELDRVGVLDTVRKQEEYFSFYKAGPGGISTLKAFSQSARWLRIDNDRALGCIRNLAHAFSPEGGLAVLYGNIADSGCVVKTAGVYEDILIFEGTAYVVESQEQAVEHVLEGKVKAGYVVVIRYEGPRGGPGMQEMLYPTSYIKAKGLGKTCALITDGRFSGGTSGLSIGHVSPEAAAGGAIGLIENGDRIRIDIPARRIDVLLEKQVLTHRRQEARGWKPSIERTRRISAALQAYAMLSTSANRGAVRTLGVKYG